MPAGPRLTHVMGRKISCSDEAALTQNDCLLCCFVHCCSVTGNLFCTFFAKPGHFRPRASKAAALASHTLLLYFVGYSVIIIPMNQQAPNTSRKRANAISLVNTPPRRSHSQEMAILFQRAKASRLWDSCERAIPPSQGSFKHEDAIAQA